MTDFIEIVAAVCVANYLLAVVAVSARRWTEKRTYKKWTTPDTHA